MSQTTELRAEDAPRADGVPPLAIVSLVLSIVWAGGVGSILALVFGYIAAGQVNRGEYREGRSLARAGVILGWVGVIGSVLVFVVVVMSAGMAVQNQFTETCRAIGSASC